MPVLGDNRVQAPAGKDWKPVPEDVYQVVIKDIDEKIMKKFQSEDEEPFYHFKLVILDGEGETALQQVTCFCSMKWFSGNKKASPSKLVTLVKAVYAHYYPKLSVVELEAEEMTPGVINDLIGKQLRVAVKLNEDKTNNKITEFMSIKKELPIPEGIEIAVPAKKLLEKPGLVKDNEKEESSEKKEQSDDSDLPF